MGTGKVASMGGAGGGANYGGGYIIGPLEAGEDEEQSGSGGRLSRAESGVETITGSLMMMRPRRAGDPCAAVHSGACRRRRRRRRRGCVGGDETALEESWHAAV